jgi:hypothetical protein
VKCLTVCLLRLVFHVHTYHAVIINWNQMGDAREVPQDVCEYAVRSYRELKAAQLRLTGGKVGR